MAELAGATCPQHQGVLAVDLCERCGRFVCGECVSLRADKTWCVDCAGKPAGPSRRATAALVIAVVGFLCGTPLSLVAIVLGLIEQRAIERGDASADGLPRAKWAVRLGVAQVILFVLTLAALLARMRLQTG